MNCQFCGGKMVSVEDDHEEDDDNMIVVMECEQCGAVLKDKY